jgi:DNA polymerase-1
MANKFALLDYDGYVCKAYYAAIARELYDIEDAEKIMLDLENVAIDKAKAFFNQDVEVGRFMSGHTFKKDIYPSYKIGRKKDEYLGAFRDYVKEKYMHKIIWDNCLEADDLITLAYESKGREKNCIVFSDDKDLRYYNEQYCKINTTEEINFFDDLGAKYEQMLYGDKEDDINGIPKVGEKTAKKLLQEYGYSFKSVIEIYRDKGVDIDECMKQILLISPISYDYVSRNNKNTYDMIIEQVQYFNKIIKEIYANGKKN